MTHDIRGRDDVVRLVDAFYGRVQHDEILGPIFNDVARVDWAAHLPKMYDFWDTVLFGRAAFKGNPMAVHRDLALRVALTDLEFGRWLALFRASLAELFDGPVAAEAACRAESIAAIMRQHVAAS